MREVKGALNLPSEAELPEVTKSLSAPLVGSLTEGNTELYSVAECSLLVTCTENMFLRLAFLSNSSWSFLFNIS